MEMMSMNFGESRTISISVSSIKRCVPFEVSNAKYELRTLNGDVESSGECNIQQINIDAFYISAFIKPLRKCCVYELEYIYDIHPETFRYTCKIRVV